MLRMTVQERSTPKRDTPSGGFLHSYYFGENPNTVNSIGNKFSGLGNGSAGTNNGGENLYSPQPVKKTGNVGYPVLKTKSSDAIHSKPSYTKPGKLSKTKSSTFISPEQSERIMYNSKVTLTLRRSRQNLNIDDDTCSQSNSPGSDTNGCNELEKLPPSIGLNGRVLKRAEEIRSQCPTPPPLYAKPSLRHTVRVNATHSLIY